MNEHTTFRISALILVIVGGLCLPTAGMGEVELSQDQTDKNDQDSDGLPDHLDWSNTNRFDFVKQEKYDLIDAQLIAFEKYGIVYPKGFCFHA